MTELSSTLGLRDLHDLLEIIAVNAHNKRVLEKAAEQAK